MRIENTDGRFAKSVRGADVCGDSDPVAVFPGVAQERLEALPDVRAVARQACPGRWPLVTVAHNPLVGVTRREVADGFESLAVGRRDRAVAAALEIAEGVLRRGVLRQSPGEEERRGFGRHITEEGDNKGGVPSVATGADEEEAGTGLGNAVVVGPEDGGRQVVVSTEALSECGSEVRDCRVVGSAEVVPEPQDILQEHQARPDEFDELEIGLEQGNCASRARRVGPRGRNPDTAALPRGGPLGRRSRPTLRHASRATRVCPKVASRCGQARRRRIGCLRTGSSRTGFRTRRDPSRSPGGRASRLA